MEYFPKLLKSKQWPTVVRLKLAILSLVQLETKLPNSTLSRIIKQNIFSYLIHQNQSTIIDKM